MKKYSKILIITFFVLFSGLLASCVMPPVVTPTERAVISISADESTIPSQIIVGTFDINTMDIAVNYDDGITEYIDVNSTMISSEDLAKFNIAGNHYITINYNGFTTVLNIAVVEKNEVNVDELINSVKNSISVPKTATENFTLPTSKDGVTISWTSSSDYIKVTGGSAVVTRPTTANASVSLTATFKYDTTSKSISYIVVVEKTETSGGNTNESTGYVGDYYDVVNLTLVGEALKQELRSLMLSTHVKYTSYSDCKTYLPSIDEDLSNPNNMILFYTGQSIKKSQDLNNDWNREHVWAKSLAWFDTSGGGSDLHHIRPCNISVNSSRGNKKFGVGGSYYTPTDEYKGDVARIIFYLMIAYKEADGYSFTSIAQSKELLLQWNELDPVSELEIVRNDKVEKIQGNRNPFIDYPYLADSLWG